MFCFKRITSLLIVVLLVVISVGCGKLNNSDSINDDGKGAVSNEDEYTMLAYKYCAALLDYTFDNGETVPVDDLMNYFCIYELMDEKGYFKECYSECVQDYPNITIPKEMVNNRLEEPFDVVIDDIESVWISSQDEDCYYLPIMTRGGKDVPQVTAEKITEDNGSVILNCKMTYNVLVDTSEYILEEETVYLIFEMSNSEDGNIKFLSCKKTDQP